MSKKNKGNGENKNVRIRETQNNKRRARRELDKVMQILAQWNIPEKIREKRAEEILHFLREEGYTGMPTERVILAVMEGEL